MWTDYMNVVSPIGIRGMGGFEIRQVSAPRGSEKVLRGGLLETVFLPLANFPAVSRIGTALQGFFVLLIMSFFG